MGTMKAGIRLNLSPVAAGPAQGGVDARTDGYPFPAATFLDGTLSDAGHVNVYGADITERPRAEEKVRQLGLYWLLLNQPPPARKGSDA